MRPNAVSDCDPRALLGGLQGLRSAHICGEITRVYLVNFIGQFSLVCSDRIDSFDFTVTILAQLLNMSSVEDSF